MAFCLLFFGEKKWATRYCSMYSQHRWRPHVGNSFSLHRTNLSFLKRLTECKSLFCVCVCVCVFFFRSGLWKSWERLVTMCKSAELLFTREAYRALSSSWTRSRTSRPSLPRPSPAWPSPAKQGELSGNMAASKNWWVSKEKVPLTPLVEIYLHCWCIWYTVMPMETYTCN